MSLLPGWGGGRHGWPLTLQDVVVSGKINLLHYVAKVGVVAGRFLGGKGRIIMVFFG